MVQRRNPDVNDSVRELQIGKGCIAESEATFIVREDKKVLVCTCTAHQKKIMCTHISCSRWKNCLHEYISKFQYSPAGADHRPAFKRSWPKADKETEKRFSKR